MKDKSISMTRDDLNTRNGFNGFTNAECIYAHNYMNCAQALVRGLGQDYRVVWRSLFQDAVVFEQYLHAREITCEPLRTEYVSDKKTDVASLKKTVTLDFNVPVNKNAQHIRDAILRQLFSMSDDEINKLVKDEDS